MFNMADPLIECSKEQERSVNLFLPFRGVKNSEIYVRMPFQHADKN
jgi:hypothetical protein